jgi:polyphenol oxidase
MKLLEYELEQRGSTLLVTFSHISVPHATSTRVGGFSAAPYDSLNLGKMSGDDLHVVERNRELFAELIGFPIRHNLQMTHGTEVVHIPDEESWKTPSSGDAAITANSAVSLSLTTADCVPIFFHDPEVNAVGVAHAGWRGTLAGIAARTVEAMVQQLGATPGNIRVGIGPSIGPCCFEVSADVRDPFSAHFGERPWIAARGADKWTVDLHQANLEYLHGAGVRGEHIRVCDLCTSCRSDLFYSYRRDKGRTGRLLSAIRLEADAIAPSC